MKKIFKTKKDCRKTTIVIRTFFFIIVVAMIFVTIRLYYLNHNQVENPQFTDGNLKIIMVDVGNGDCFLLLQNDKAMLVDTGYITTYSNVKKVLKENNVQKIDYVVITHPHRDHAGGIFGLLFDYQVCNLYMAEDLGEMKMSITEKLFYYPETAIIKYTDLFANNIVDVKCGTRECDFQFANSQVEFLAPLNNNYEKLNNYSLVFKLTYEENSILFTADMEMINERELLEAGVDVSADIIKIAHHGNNTSTSEEFLQAVSPQYAMVSSDNGNHNKYGHPVKRIVQYLEVQQIPLYRTDELGSVEIDCDGKSIIFLKKPGDYKSGTQYLEEKNNYTRM